MWCYDEDSKGRCKADRERGGSLEGRVNPDCSEAERAGEDRRLGYTCCGRQAAPATGPAKDPQGEAVAVVCVAASC